MSHAAIETEGVCKRFGTVRALDEVSFQVERNRVVGFLGANGAGKTTTMRILACFLPPTSGTARVGGYDCFTESMAVRRELGYLPETIALYEEMRVEEYLTYMATLQEIPARQRSGAVDRVVERCWLTDVRRKLCGALSKGYRQRVGLAEAMIHTPPILILDEPTAGLDPVQIRETRKLIKQLGQDHTVLLSTHILSEVEMICSDVVIITAGRIAASAGLEKLIRESAEPVIVVEATAEAASVRKVLGTVTGAAKVRPAIDLAAAGHCRFEILPEPDADPRGEIVAKMSRNDLGLLEIHTRRKTLEDIYVEVSNAEAEI